MKRFISILIVLTMLFASTVNVFAEEAASTNVIDQNDTYTRMELHVDNGGEDIYGELYLPENADGKVPLVILTHGLGGTCAGGERYAVQFAEMGIATYCYDLRFASVNSRSNNDTTKLTPFTAKSDLQAVIDTSKTWDFVDKDNVFLMGYSLGGLTSGITAPDNMDYIKAEIMFYPAFVVQDEVRRLAAMGDDMPDTFEFTGVTVGRAIVDETKDYDLYAQAQRFEKDVLLIHGDADPVVPISCSELLKAGLSSVEYHVIRDGVHSFQGEHFVEAMTYVKNFLYREINGAETVAAPLPIWPGIENLTSAVEWNEEDKSLVIRLFSKR